MMKAHNALLWAICCLLAFGQGWSLVRQREANQTLMMIHADLLRVEVLTVAIQRDMLVRP